MGLALGGIEFLSGGGQSWLGLGTLKVEFVDCAR